METFFWITFGVACLASTAVFIEHFGKRRREAFMKLSASLGLAFDPEASAVHTLHPQNDLFKRGHDCKPSNLLRGKLGSFEEVMLFEYLYTTGGGKSRAVHYFTVAGFRLPPPPLPPFQLRPEGWLDKLAAVVGFDDMDFESDPEFSKAFHLKTTDTAATAVLFHGGVRDAFRRDRAWSAESSGEWLFLFQKESFDPEKWPALLQRARAIAETFLAP